MFWLPIAFLAFPLRPAEIQLDRRVASVAAVVRELAEKSGLPLVAGPTVDDEVLYADLGPQPADRLMELIAQADSAEWVRDAKRSTLTRRRSLADRQRRADVAAAAKAFDDRIAGLVSPVDAAVWTKDEMADRVAKKRTPPAASPGEDVVRQKLARKPFGRLLSRVLRGLDTTALAESEFGVQYRFATSPTASQRPLPANGSSLDQFVTEFNGLQEQIALRPRSQFVRLEADNFGVVNSEPPRLESAPNILLSFLRPTPMRAQLEFTAYDANGHLVDAFGLTFPTPDSDTAKTLPRWSTWRSNPVALDRDSQVFLGIDRQKGDRETLAHRMADPVACDPLSIFLTGPMGDLRRAVGCDVIARLPDELTADVFRALTEEHSLGDFADALDGYVRFTGSNGILVGEDRRPAESLEMKLNREGLKRFFVQINARGCPRIADVAAYVAGQGDGGALTSLETSCIAAVAGPEVCSQLAPIFDVMGGQRDAYRFYDALSPAQQGALWTDRAFPVADLSAAAADRLATMVLRRSATIVVPNAGPRDPTCWLDRIPDSAIVAARHAEAPVLSAADKGEPGPFYGAALVGAVIAHQEHGEWLDAAAGYPRLGSAKLIPGFSRSVSLKLNFSPRAFAMFSLTDFDIDLHSSGVAYADLPPTHLGPLLTARNAVKASPGAFTSPPAGIPPR